MKFAIIALLFLAACTTPLKPQPSGTKEITGKQGRGTYWVTKIFEAPACTFLYMPGVDETENPVRSGKYPHAELVPMAKKRGCNIASFSYGTVWLLDADIAPAPPICWFTGGCDLGPSMDEFVRDLDAVLVKEKLPQRIFASGVSQGGFNLSRLAMKYPKKFEKIIVAHPVMKYRGYNFMMETMLVNKNFTNFAKVNPVELIKTVTAISPVYVSSCNDDSLVPPDAAQEFAKRCKARGFDCTLHIDKAGCAHGAFDSKPAIDWMAK